MESYIVIPAYNEELTVADIAERAKPYGVVVVIDDGSTDRTQEAIVGVEGIEYELVPENRGKGAALRTGYRKIAALNPDYNDVVVTIDSDGQHRPEDIVLLENKLTMEGLDVVIGARNKSTYPWRKRLGNWGLTKIVNLFAGTSLTDTESGFRAMRWKVVHSLLPRLKSDRYSTECEHIILAGNLGFKFGEVIVETPYLAGRGVTVMDGLKNGVFAFKTWLRIKCMRGGK